MASSSRRLISSGSPFEQQIGYSRAVVDGDMVFVSGCTGCVKLPLGNLYPVCNQNTNPTYCRYDYKTGVMSDDVVEQTEQTMQNIQAALEEAEAEMKDIVRVRYILPDRRDFQATWPVLQKWLGDVRPAATMIQAGLMEEAMKIEIEVTARRARG